jgi:hypothetical protein
MLSYALHVPACVPTVGTNDSITSASPVLTVTSAHDVLVLLVQSNASGVIVALPDPDPQRPHMFLELTVDNRNVGASLTGSSSSNSYNDGTSSSTSGICHPSDRNVCSRNAQTCS